MIHTLSVRTTSRIEMVDITGQIQELVRQSGVEEGVCHIFVAHTTAGLTINENADPSVQADILMVLNKIISDQEAYRHLGRQLPGPYQGFPHGARSSRSW